MKTDKKQLGNQKRIMQQKLDLFARLNELESVMDLSRS